MNYIYLSVVTDYTLLSSLIKIDDLISYAKNNNLKYAKAYSIKLKSLAKLRNFLK